MKYLGGNSIDMMQENCEMEHGIEPLFLLVIGTAQ
jgi:hypothetical protein